MTIAIDILREHLIGAKNPDEWSVIQDAINYLSMRDDFIQLVFKTRHQMAEFLDAWPEIKPKEVPHD